MKLGLVQMQIEFENKALNREKCLKFINEAALKQVDLLLFPEMSLTGFSMNVESMGELENETVKWFKVLAEKHNIYLGFGHIEKTLDKGKNEFSIVSPAGKELCRYTKIHPFSYGTESKFYTGGRKIVQTSLKDFQITPFICYDLRFPEIFQMASKSSQLITVAANWPKSRSEHWITLLKARAIENQCYIAGVNAVGNINSLEYSGDSMIIDPLGNVLVQETNKEALLTADLDINEVYSIRKTFPLKNDRKEELYSTIEITSK
jgi:predicted amidohydrolase